jgi:hypothetical protein
MLVGYTRISSNNQYLHRQSYDYRRQVRLIEVQAQVYFLRVMRSWERLKRISRCAAPRHPALSTRDLERWALPAPVVNQVRVLLIASRRGVAQILQTV